MEFIFSEVGVGVTLPTLGCGCDVSQTTDLKPIFRDAAAHGLAAANELAGGGGDDDAEKTQTQESNS